MPATTSETSPPPAPATTGGTSPAGTRGTTRPAGRRWIVSGSGVAGSCWPAGRAEARACPGVLKPAEPAITHKSDVRGVLLGIADPAALAAGYADLAARLGPRVLVG